MKLFLIGQRGQVGREIEKLATQNGIYIVGFDIESLNISDIKQVTENIEKHSDVDFVINTAAYTQVDKAEDEKENAFAANEEGVVNLASVCKKLNIPLLHISTDYVFSGEKSEPYTESDTEDPINIYGQSKLAGDKALISIWEKHIILRVSWVFGKYGQNFVKTILKLAKERESLSIVCDQNGCPTAAEDIARVLLEICFKIKNQDSKEKKEIWGIYNYCGSPSTSWFEFAKEIIRLGKERQPLLVKNINAIKTSDFPTRAKRPKNSELKVEKIIDVFKIKRESWQHYLKKVLEEISL